MTELVFRAFAGIAIVSALLCITRKSPVASALWLIVTLFALSGLYVILDAQFIGVLQVLVYAGAIMVLFLFVIMLLNLGRQRTSDMKGWVARTVTALIGAAMLLQLWVLRGAMPDESMRLPIGTMARMAEAKGAVRLVADPLFREYMVPFEITSILLLAAVVGAVVLAKRKV